MRKIQLKVEVDKDQSQMRTIVPQLKSEGWKLYWVVKYKGLASLNCTGKRVKLAYLERTI